MNVNKVLIGGRYIVTSRGGIIMKNSVCSVVARRCDIGSYNGGGEIALELRHA